MYKDNIGIIGLGKLGLPMLAAFVSRGFNPKGYDINQSLIDSLKQRLCPYQEPGLEEVIATDLKWPERFTTEFNSFLNSVDTLFVIVPTPTKNDVFDVKYLDAALAAIADNKGSKRSLTCVITSTVNPGDCDKFIQKYGNASIRIVYSPEFIALGSVLRDMLNPDVVLLGGQDSSDIDKVFSIYSRLYKSHPEYHRLSYFEAETAKIAINTYITTKISYANTIGLFVERATNSRIAAQRVLDAIGGDSRIGRKYFRYGTSYGGPCFPRDNRALASHLKNKGIDPAIPIATDEVNKSLLKDWKQRLINGKYDALVLVGVAYKEGTDFLEESFMINLGVELEEIMDIYFIDPKVKVCGNFSKISKNSDLDILKKYEKGMILINYADKHISLENVKCEKLKIWC